MNTMNVNSALRTLSFLTPKGHQVMVDPTGLNTKISLTDATQTHRFTLKEVVKNDAGYLLVATTGQMIQVNEADGMNVRAVHDQNLPRQRMGRMARNIFLGIFGFLVLLVIIIGISN